MCPLQNPMQRTGDSVHFKRNANEKLIEIKSMILSHESTIQKIYHSLKNTTITNALLQLLRLLILMAVLMKLGMFLLFFKTR